MIVKTICGSKLFGLTTPNSDTDYKVVFQSSLEDIILGKDIKTASDSTKIKNTKDDVDTEYKELRTFVKDCLKGQTYALEMLYTPKELVLNSSPIWDFIVANRSKLTPSDLSSFVGYAFSQAQKYSLRGTRLKEFERLAFWFQNQDKNSLLADVIWSLELSKETYSETYIHPDGTKEQRLVCFGMIVQFAKKIKEILPTLQKRLAQYGDRSKNNKEIGTDWKAYSHAFRLLYEWEQLLLEGRLTFLIKNRDFVLSVKLGEQNLEKIQDLLFLEYQRISKIPNKLPLPDPDFWDKWLISIYKNS